MKLIIVAFLAVVAVAVAEYEPVKIVRSEFQQNPEGPYEFNFETEDGVVRSETGEVKEVLDEDNKPQKVVVVRGSYSYKNSDGFVDSINYYADETGFHADGPSIPKPVEPLRR